MPEGLPQPDTWPSLRAKLAGPIPVNGFFSSFNCPETLELAGIAGWDFAVVDCEHAPTTSSSLPHLIRGAAAFGLPVIVRVATNAPELIQHALDAGAAGVQIPQISSLEAARQAVSASRFHPVGQRGFSPFVRAAAFSGLPLEEFMRRADQEVTLVLQIESQAGMAALDGIVDLPGIDVLFLGPYDLSQSLGVAGQTSHPKVIEAVRKICQVAGDRGIHVGVFTRYPEEAGRWLSLGVRYLCYSVDTLILLEGFRKTVEEARSSWEPVGD
jgi:4-hydroxy-2-oxoheptanedioate aldolase